MTYLTKFLAATFILVFIFTGVHAQCYSDKDTSGDEVVGTLLGAAVGGLVGSQIGGGTGNKIAIGAGVLAGGYLGNRIARNLSCRDIEYHNTTTQNTLETQRTGTTGSWNNPDSGHSGSITPTRTYTATTGRPCRDFTQTIMVDGQPEEIQSTACRNDDGTWELVQG